MATRPTIDDFEAWNEEMARKYDPEDYHLHSSLAIRLIDRCRVKTVLRLAAASKNDKVLEVGCGAGNVLEQVKQSTLVGIGLSDFMLNKARRRLGPRVALVKANAEKLPFVDEVFGKIRDCSKRTLVQG